MIDFTIDELKILYAVVQNLNYKIGDARLILPIYDKLKSAIPEETKQEPVKS